MLQTYETLYAVNQAYPMIMTKAASIVKLRNGYLSFLCGHTARAVPFVGSLRHEVFAASVFPTLLLLFPTFLSHRHL